MLPKFYKIINRYRTIFPLLLLIIISTYINTKMCLCVCVCVSVFLGHLEADWDTLWNKSTF